MAKHDSSGGNVYNEQLFKMINDRLDSLADDVRQCKDKDKAYANGHNKFYRHIEKCLSSDLDKMKDELDTRLDKELGGLQGLIDSRQKYDVFAKLLLLVSAIVFGYLSYSFATNSSSFVDQNNEYVKVVERKLEVQKEANSELQRELSEYKDSVARKLDAQNLTIKDLEKRITEISSKREPLDNNTKNAEKKID
ncbi:hypothetical protein [Desulfovibrio sp. JC022]|uniref:hypothetical protein n=1 Tax=Desulfovibrio sp. JC022 TaxID=2593642 RepID=UPI0013D74CE3|nr:hypothetical protein [Desulfovibrio sp. JC022]NDV23814.1 hypothetical protein [Desulfovibrio sp. JC022]